MSAKIKTHNFANGFRLIYEKSSNDLPLSAVNVFCDVGSIDEPEPLFGASHLVEHMCFKGTRKHAESKEIFVQYDEIGAYINAFTTNRATGYVVKCNSIYLQNSLQILADMMLHSVFDRGEFTKEHQVVIEENIKDENSPRDVILVESDRTTYAGSSFGHPVDDVKFHLSKTGALRKDSLKYADVVAFYRRFYHPKNMILSVVSNLSFENILRIVKTTDYVKDGRGVTDITAVVSCRNYTLLPKTNIEVRMIPKSGVDNVLLSIAFRVCGNNSRDKYCLEFAKNVLVNTMSGRFFMVLREKRGLVYGCSISTQYYDTVGDFTIFTQTDRRKVLGGSGRHGVVSSFVEIFNDLIKNGITDEELRVVRGYIKGNSLIENEDINNQSQYNAEQYLMGGEAAEIVSLRDVYSRFYEKMTRAEIHTVIRRYFTPANMSVCILGEHLPARESIEKEFRRFAAI